MDVLSRIDAAAAGRSGALGDLPMSGGPAAMREAAQAFEAQFLGQMFHFAMRDVPVDAVFGGGPGERVFRDMLTDAWAEETVRAGGIGVADAVLRTLVEAQASKEG